VAENYPMGSLNFGKVSSGIQPFLIKLIRTKLHINAFPAYHERLNLKQSVN